MGFFISARHRWLCLFSPLKQTYLLFLLSLSCISVTHAFHLSSTIKVLDRYIIDNTTGTLQVIDPVTETFIPQGPATDAGGTDFDASAVLWLVFSFCFGPPMSFAGIRGWKLTTGVGVGLAVSVVSWATFINSIQAGSTTDLDLIITIVVLVLFAGGFLFGFLKIGRTAGTFLLGITGGLAFGIRVMILKSNLLISKSSLFPLNWFLIIICAIAGGVGVQWEKAQRTALLLSCASIGTFLTSLGLDLAINKQNGISRGLRFLFDRNSDHYTDIVVGGYAPPRSTIIIIGTSLGVIPILALAQHYVFKGSFRPDIESNGELTKKAKVRFRLFKTRQQGVPTIYVRETTES